MKFKKVFIPQLPPNYFVLEFYDFVGSFKAAKWPKSSPARWRSIKLDSMDDAIRDCWRHYIANNFIPKSGGAPKLLYVPPDLDRCSRCAKFLPEGYEIRTVDLIPVQYDLHYPNDVKPPNGIVARFKFYEECVIAALSHELSRLGRKSLEPGLFVDVHKLSEGIAKLLRDISESQD